VRRAWLLLMTASLGCASATTLGTARTLEPGVLQPSVSVKAPMPLLEVGVRRGLTESVDVGARVGGYFSTPMTVLSVAADSKVQLRRSVDPGSGWDFAVVPGAGYEQAVVGGQRLHSVHFSLPLLLGKNLGRHQLIFGPRLIDQILWNRDSETINVLFYGTSVAFAWRISEKVQLIPEASLLISGASVNASNGSVIGQLGLGVLLGG
jgi:hypothetical protein